MICNGLVIPPISYWNGVNQLVDSGHITFIVIFDKTHMSTTPDPPDNQPTQPAGSSNSGQVDYMNMVFSRLREVYFFGGVGLLVIGTAVANDGSTSPGGGFAGLGLCIAGGLCFVASAIVHSGSK